MHMSVKIRTAAAAAAAATTTTTTTTNNTASTFVFHNCLFYLREFNGYTTFVVVGQNEWRYHRLQVD